MQQTVSCSSTEFLKFSFKPKAMVIMGERELGALQGETSQLHKANAGNLCKERGQGRAIYFSWYLSTRGLKEGGDGMFT